jgi:hypothetical protein
MLIVTAAKGLFMAKASGTDLDRFLGSAAQSAKSTTQRVHT